MSPRADGEDFTPLSPGEAFTVLGDETRLQILQTLGEADGPLLFSELFDRLDYRDSSNFSYHLEKLVGQFVRKTDDRYALRQAGRRIVEAVLSGAVTDDAVVEPTQVDKQCPFCSAPIEVGFQQERVEMYCTECPGLVEHAGSEGRYFTEYGSLGHMLLPPASVKGRSPTEILEAAWTWKHVDLLADSTDVCSRCSATLRHSVSVCEAHGTSGEICDQCGRRYAVKFDAHCPNCHYDVQGIAPTRLMATTRLLSFITEKGINPIAPDRFDRALGVLANYEEEVLSTDPFEAAFTFTADGEALTLTVGDDLSVIDVTRESISESA